ncbi:MAG: SH3 domain-containing protein [Bacteroidales bacterium]|nr:SH3 domain-containing protein [Bacteroidales bacterium]
MKRIILMIGALFISLLSLRAQETKELNLLYEKALTEYQENNFPEALEIFDRLIASGFSSYKLYYNAGNAAFKSGDIPLAILNYEKALLLKPLDKDLRYNLEIARTYTIDRIEVIPEVFFARWFKILSLLLRTNTWASISLLCFAVSLILLTLFLFSARYKLKKMSFIGAVIIFFISLLSISLALTNRSLTAKNNEAIVFEPVVTGTSSPGSGGNELFVIHEGTKVEIKDKLGEWYEIKLSDGSVGWVPVNYVKKIIP